MGLARDLAPERFFYRFCFFLLGAVSTGLVLFFHLNGGGLNSNSRARFLDMLSGRAHKPFVYRLFFPVTVRATSGLIRAITPESFERWIGKNSILRMLAHVRAGEEYRLEYLTAAVLMYVCLWGFLLAFRYLFQAVYSGPNWFMDAMALIAVLGVVPFLLYYHKYMYDPAALFLFTLALGLLARGKWPAFLFIFFLNCLNKETAILLTLVFGIHYWNTLDPVLFRKLLAAQLALFVFIKSGLTFLFRSNPGSFLEFHFFDLNMRFLVEFSHFVIAGILFVLIPVALWTFHKWNEKPVFLKNAVWMVLPLFFLQIFFGNFDEWRVYFEVYPVIVLLMAYTLAEVLRVRLVTVT